MNENKNSTIKKTVFTKKFRDFCKKEFANTMNELEQMRLKYLLIMKIVIIICSISVISISLMPLILFQEGISIPTLLIFFGLSVIIIVYSVIATKYKLKSKKLVLQKLLSFIGDFKKVEIEKNTVAKEIAQLKLFNPFNTWRFDDCIDGIYKGLKIEIREVHLLEVEKTSKEKKSTTIFKGLYVKVPCLKKFNSFTVIKPKLNYCFHGEKIKLEDIEFEKMFNVQGSNQIEARYLLTTAFMNRLVKLKKKKLVDNISLSFENGFVHIGVHSIKDYFEMSLFKSAKEISTYRNIILDLITILSIIDTLELDQNIGL